MKDYGVWVSEDCMTMVQIFTKESDPTPVMQVATRTHPDGIWGPPVVVREER